MPRWHILWKFSKDSYMNWFSTAAVLSYHKFSSFNNTDLLFYTPRGSEVWDGSHCSIIKVLERLCFFLEDLGRISFYVYIFQFLEAACIPWLAAPSSNHSNHFLASSYLLLWHLLSACLFFVIPLSLSGKFRVIYPSQDPQHSHIFRVLVAI